MFGQNNEDIFNTNRSLIIQYLQRFKIATRAQLSKILGLTPAAITKIIQDLTDRGIVEETGFYAGEKGRRSVGIRLNRDFLVLGAKVSRRNFSVGVFDFNGIIFDYYSEEFENLSLIQVLEKIKAKIQEFLTTNENIVSIGIAVPGPYLESESKIVLVTETEGWDNINIRKFFNNTFDIPLTIVHDAHACALSDWLLGAIHPEKNNIIVHFLIGEGVGAGVVINGNIFSGKDGYSGEVGHISIDSNGPRCQCGNYGCLESYCSSLALVKRAKILLPKYPTSPLNSYEKLHYSHIFRHSNEGDELSINLIKEAGRNIGYGVVNIINMYNPSVVVLGNQMVKDETIILSEILKTVEERLPNTFKERVHIITSMFKNDPTLYGAAAVAIDYCLKNHSSLILAS